MLGAKRGKALINDCRYELFAVEVMIAQGELAKEDLHQPGTAANNILCGIYARYGRTVFNAAVDRNKRGADF